MHSLSVVFVYCFILVPLLAAGAKEAADAGMTWIENLCIMVEHKNLAIPKRSNL